MGTSGSTVTSDATGSESQASIRVNRCSSVVKNGSGLASIRVHSRFKTLNETTIVGA
jgi:hypothetical protein